MHDRQTIREAVVARLLNQTDAAARVFATREHPLRAAELPAISVYTLEESVAAESRQTAPRWLKRSLKLAIEVTVQYSEDVDEALDDLAVDIERVMDADPTLGGQCDLILSSVNIGVDDSAEQPVGAMVMAYEITYVTDAPKAADVALDNLRTVDTRTSLAGAQATADQSEDIVSFAPVITAFALPTTSDTLEVAVSAFTATDDEGVTGYMLSESATIPAADAIGWLTSAPASFTFATPGAKTLRAWVKDAAGNVAGASATVTISEPPP